MPRQSRIHVSNGLYHVTHISNGQRPIFVVLEDYAEFEVILEKTLNQYGARVHGFCWLPDAVHIALQVNTAPLSDIMRSLGSRFAQRRLQRHQPLFRHRYHATLFDPNYLDELVRRVHRESIPIGCAELGEEPSQTSHRAYLGLTSVPWLTTGVLMRHFSLNRILAVEKYRLFMNEKVDTSRINGFNLEARHDVRIVGGPLFMRSLPRNLEIYRGTMALEDVISAVVLQQGLTREDVFSRSGARGIALGRALIAFHSTERGIATYAQVMRVLGRTGLKKSVLRFSAPDALNAKLFDVAALRNAGPLISLLQPRGSSPPIGTAE